MTKKGSKIFMTIASILIIIALVFIISSKTTMKVKTNQYKDENSISNSTNQQMNYTIDQLTKGVLENDITLVKKIIASNSVDINHKDSEGKCPLELVFVMNNYDMAKILLEAGADPYVVTSNGQTAYDLAMKSDSKYLKDIFKAYCK
ncbi:hypothetical protein SAMN02745135_02549 [Caloranaerobacter azorensis DSM 13643]|uniref:Uncharacterized protein n=1 Tax=Caloranaerobacter azorensis DSM 13643 TaxID=1121264 RepID=A0A1M5WM16_9FIRM|nr:ankyrin repeat domain-containing protein [Caloranaerobacter azorensis]SHH88556.1 hypothetical protein SAMN02745135_02549 [Caloranaerobacter azorensis DSM 13643]